VSHTATGGIWFLRHGEPTSYRDGGLTPVGRTQVAASAAAVAGSLAAGGPVTVHTSPARRCRQSARIAATVLRSGGVTVVGPVQAPALAMVRARLDGSLVDVGLARDRADGAPGDELRAFWRDHADGLDPFDRWHTGAYATFETPDEVADRVRAFLDALVPPAVVVSHSEIIRIAHEVLGVEPGGLPFGAAAAVTMPEPTSPGGPA
jgi:broad specificity phosphatase PhoE